MKESNIVFIKPYGCAYARYLAQTLGEKLVARNYHVFIQPFGSDRQLCANTRERKVVAHAAAVIFLPCSLTEYHQRCFVIPAVKEIVRMTPSKRVLVTGCVTSKTCSAFSEAGAQGVDGDIRHIAKGFNPCRGIGGIQDFGSRVVLLKAGCEQPCRYCSCAMRGKDVETRSFAAVKSELRRIASSGVRHIEFAGPDSGAWKDVKASAGIADLLWFADGLGLKIMNLELHPGHVSGDVLSFLQERPMSVEGLSIPAQHFSTKLLRKMGRGYGYRELRKIFCVASRIPGLFISTDIIIGHPGEKATDMAWLERAFVEFRFDRIDCYPYAQQTLTRLKVQEREISAEEITARIGRLERHMRNVPGTVFNVTSPDFRSKCLG